MIESFNRVCGSLVGGVATIELIEARQLALPTFDSSKTRCSQPQTVGNDHFVRVNFIPGSGSYIQTATVSNGMTEVYHALRFELPAREDTASFIDSLNEATRLGGLVARVKLNTGLELLIGVSPLLGYEQALRMGSSRHSVEAERDERPVSYIMLECYTESLTPVLIN